MRVWLTRDCELYLNFSDEKKFCPAGTCFTLGDVAHWNNNLMFVFGGGVFDSVPLDWLTLTPPVIEQGFAWL